MPESIVDPWRKQWSINGIDGNIERRLILFGPPLGQADPHLLGDKYCNGGRCVDHTRCSQNKTGGA